MINFASLIQKYRTNIIFICASPLFQTTVCKPSVKSTWIILAYLELFSIDVLCKFCVCRPTGAIPATSCSKELQKTTKRPPRACRSNAFMIVRWPLSMTIHWYIYFLMIKRESLTHWYQQKALDWAINADIDIHLLIIGKDVIDYMAVELFQFCFVKSVSGSFDTSWTWCCMAHSWVIIMNLSAG